MPMVFSSRHKKSPPELLAPVGFDGIGLLVFFLLEHEGHRLIQCSTLDCSTSSEPCRIQSVVHSPCSALMIDKLCNRVQHPVGGPLRRCERRPHALTFV